MAFSYVINMIFEKNIFVKRRVDDFFKFKLTLCVLGMC